VELSINTKLKKEKQPMSLDFLKGKSGFNDEGWQYIRIEVWDRVLH
jgi:hypothetical protein